jgi:membrane protease YdiL (CAAX protease family)
MENNQSGYYYSDAPGGHNYYQNLYNMFGGKNPLVDSSFCSLARLGNLAGCGLLLAFFIQSAVSLVISLIPLGSAVTSDVFYTHGISALLQAVYTLLPFVIVYFFNKPEDKKLILDFDFPKSRQLYILAVAAGLMFCLLGNKITSVLSVLFTLFGVEFFAGNEGMEMPSTIPAIIVFVINYAVLPAMFEEFAFRNVLLQPLRKFGDWYAIVATSFCFAILHGNMVQIPFSFIAGIALGYFRVRTGSIWTSITIHFLNNLISVIFSLCVDRNPENATFAYTVISTALILIGFIALLIFKKNCNIKLKKDPTPMSKFKALKRGAYIGTPSVVVALFFSIITSVSLATTTSSFAVFLMIVAVVIVAHRIYKWLKTILSETQITQLSRYRYSKIIVIIGTVIVLLHLITNVG